MNTKTAEKILRMQKDQKEFKLTLTDNITKTIMNDESGVMNRIPPTIATLIAVDSAIEILAVAAEAETDGVSEDSEKVFYLMLVDKILDSIERYLPITLRSVDAGDKETLSKIEAIIDFENAEHGTGGGSTH